MTAFDAPFWNLAQAAAWVVYRKSELVERLASPSEVAFAAVGLYPNTWPAGRTQYAQLSELHRALIEGRLPSEGYHEDRPNSLAPIPAADWDLLDLHPPVAYHRRYPGRRYEPWKEIRVRGADVLKMWRGLDQKRDQTLFDWDEIRQIFEEITSEHSDCSKNKRIEKTKDEYAKRHGNRCPSTSSFKRHMKNWT